MLSNRYGIAPIRHYVSSRFEILQNDGKEHHHQMDIEFIIYTSVEFGIVVDRILPRVLDSVAFRESKKAQKRSSKECSPHNFNEK